MLDCADSEVDLDAAAPPPRRPGEEPIPGYRLLEPLGKGGFGEVWKCQAPGGLFKAIKLVCGNSGIASGDADLAGQELRALEFIKNIRHPFVLSVERVELVENTLAIVMELADRNLDDLGRDHRDQGKPGIPRTELLEYLAEAAEALDLINFQHGLQHLDIKPQNLFVVSRHLKVADFGLVTRLARHGCGDQAAAGPGVTPRYAAPETLERKPSRQSDQYSLAIVYQELLTGELPFKGRNSSQLFLQHLKAEPDLNALPVCDRPVIARALAKNSELRFRSCTDLVRALLLADSGSGSGQSPDLCGIIRQHKLAATAGDRPASEAAPAAPARTSAARKPAYSLRGHVYQRQVGRTPLGELWQVTTPAGEEKTAHHLTGFAVDNPQEQAKALLFLQSLNHPALVRFEVAELGPNRIVLLSHAAAPTLADCRKSKDLPTGELIGYLTEVAEALDALLTTTNRCHLGLNPGNIVLGLDGVQIRDFGLVARLWQPGAVPLTRCNPRYAAPELDVAKTSAASDQYSLAVIFLDMFQATNPPGHGKQATPGRSAIASLTDLSQFPERERSVLLRALDRNPENRFASNLQFVQALAQALQQRGIASTATRSVFLAAQAGFLGHLRQWINRQRALGAPADAAGLDGHSPLPDGSQSIAFAAQLLPGTAPLRLEIFRQEWNAMVTQQAPEHFHLFIPLTRTFWQRLRSEVIGVHIDVVMEAPTRANGMSRFRAALRPVGCQAGLVAEIRESLGPAILTSLRTSFSASPERRRADRLPFARPVTVRHRASGQRPVEQLCQGRDISANGISFVAPTALDPCEVRVQFLLTDDPEDTPVILRAKIIRCDAQSDGAFEVGAQFLQDNFN